MSSGSRNESSSHQLARNGERKILYELDVRHVQKVGIKRFCAQEAEMSSGGRNESNSHQLARIGESKIFRKLNVHHVQTVGIKRFSAQEAEMSLTAMSSLESARRKFFMNSTYIMSRKQESNVFRRTSYLESRNQTFWAKEGEMSSGGRNESNSHQLARNGERKIFHEFDVHHVQKVGVKRFWAQEAQMSLTANTSLESARERFFMSSTYIMSRQQESNVFLLRTPK